MDPRVERPGGFFMSETKMTEFLRPNVVTTQMGHKSRTPLYQSIREGTFIRPIKIGRKAVGFPAAEVEQILSARAAGASIAQIKQLVSSLHAQRAERLAQLFAV